MRTERSERQPRSRDGAPAKWNPRGLWAAVSYRTVSAVHGEGHRAGGPLKVPTATGSCYCRRFRYARSPRRPVPNRNREAGTGTESTVAEVMNGSPPEASPKLLMVIVLSVCEANSTGSAYVCMSRCTSPPLGVDFGI